MGIVRVFLTFPCSCPPMGLSIPQPCQPPAPLEQSAINNQSITYPWHGSQVHSQDFFHPFNQPSQLEKKITLQTSASLQSDENCPEDYSPRAYNNSSIIVLVFHAIVFLLVGCTVHSSELQGLLWMRHLFIAAGSPQSQWSLWVLSMT